MHHARYLQTALTTRPNGAGQFAWTAHHACQGAGRSPLRHSQRSSWQENDKQSIDSSYFFVYLLCSESWLVGVLGVVFARPLTSEMLEALLLQTYILHCALAQPKLSLNSQRTASLGPPASQYASIPRRRCPCLQATSLPMSAKAHLSTY